MYALIYDEFDRSKREKKVISVHRTREAADKALEKRQHLMDKRVWECSARIVWVYNQVRTGDTVTPDSFDTWATGFRTGINRVRQKVIEITMRLVAEIAPMVQGEHFMSLGWSDVVVRVIEQIQDKQRNFARASGA